MFEVRCFEECFLLDLSLRANTPVVQWKMSDFRLNARVK